MKNYFESKKTLKSAVLKAQNPVTMVRALYKTYKQQIDLFMQLTPTRVDLMKLIAMREESFLPFFSFMDSIKGSDFQSLQATVEKHSFRSIDLENAKNLVFASSNYDDLVDTLKYEEIVIWIVMKNT